MPKEYEYHERKKAQEEFEEGMKAPVPGSEESQTSESGPSRDSGERPASGRDQWRLPFLFAVKRSLEAYL